MHLHLEGLLARSKRATQQIHEAWGSATDEQMTWKPTPEKWSMAECLEHLVITGQAYKRVMEPGIERARASGKPADAPVRFTWFGRLFVSWVGPQSERSFKAPAPFQPVTHSRSPDVIDSFNQIQGQIEDWIRQSDAAPLNGPKLTSPVSRLIRLTVGEVLAVLVGHTERHVAQALQVRNNPAFPR